MVAADKPLLNQVRIFVDADKNLLRLLVVTSEYRSQFVIVSHSNNTVKISPLIVTSNPKVFKRVTSSGIHRFYWHVTTERSDSQFSALEYIVLSAFSLL